MTKAQRRVVKLGFIIFYIALAIFTILVVLKNGQYPTGDNVMYHFYRGEFLYKEILKGNWFPLYDPNWYNGVELFRYWPPLVAYVQAACIFAAGGDAYLGYLFFIGLLVLGSGIVWLRIGDRLGRTVLGGLFGALWFFIPNNLFVTFGEGNLPRMVTLIFLPWLLYRMYEYETQKKAGQLLGVFVTYMLIVLCSFDYAIVVLLALSVFLLINGMMGGKFRKNFHILGAMVLAIGATGIWMIPAVNSEVKAFGNLANLSSFFQPIWDTLNPFRRFNSIDVIYFGAASMIALVLAIVGIERKRRPYLYTALVILLMTGSGMYPIINQLPYKGYMPMLTQISVALSMVLFAMLLWKQARPTVVVLLLVLQVVDILPSASYLYGYFDNLSVDERFEETSADYLIDIAKEVTVQRAALLDGGELGAEGAYLLSSYEGDVQTSFGADRSMSATAQNLVLLSDALEGGAYTYLFDRALELGNDTLLIKVSQMENKTDDIGRLDHAAEIVGYELVYFNNDFRLYHMETPECFGTITEYTAAGIGEGVTTFAMRYPDLEELSDTVLDHYTYEQLCDYELLYLDRFTYKDRLVAEELIQKLADHGVRIVISGTGIPVDEATGIQSFLGVNCQAIEFRNGYPLLQIDLGAWDTALFKDGYSQWKTVYLQGLDKSFGYFEEIGQKLDFMGTAYNDNVVFIGIGLPYHFSLTGDPETEFILNRAMQRDYGVVPKRTLVPLKVTREKNTIRIVSPEDNVNTTLAYHSMFHSNRNLASERNLLYVNEGETYIEMQYPYFTSGTIVSVGSILALFGLLMFVRAFWNRRDIDAVDVFGVARPEAEQKVGFGYLIPERVKYFVTKVRWFTEEGVELTADDTFGEGRFRVTVDLQSNDDEVFGKEPVATINHFNVEAKDMVIFSPTHIQISMDFTAAIPFRFLEQPTALSATIGDVLVIKWKISQEPKIGYLQKKEGENWIIQDVLPCTPLEELQYNLTEDYLTTSEYRFVYIMGNGRTYTGTPFTVSFVGKPK